MAKTRRMASRSSSSSSYKEERKKRGVRKRRGGNKRDKRKKEREEEGGDKWEMKAQNNVVKVLTIFCSSSLASLILSLSLLSTTKIRP